MREQDVGEESKLLPLFETREARFRGAYKLFASTIFASIGFIWLYRLTNIPAAKDIQQGSRWAWITLFVSEVAYGVYWIITQSVRWRIVCTYPFKERLLNRYEEDIFPTVDIFVCTADPILEPPCMVMNTVLSAMAYNYPSNKLSVYLSDDGGSELTFFALIQASIFSKHWLPFCRRFNVESRSPEAYFATAQNCSSGNTDEYGQALLYIKKLYKDMNREIESVVAKGMLPDDERSRHMGFSEWNLKTTKQDHHSIVQIIIDGRDTNAVDEDGFQLPTLVYMAREKRPNIPHHFKAGAMNALIRVSSEISNAPYILNLDCDMYPNNADTIQEVLCFFMDEAKGREIAYVQFPQNFNNITKNDHYGNSFPIFNEVEHAGLCGHGASLYCGTGCFHRRQSLSGAHFKDYKAKLDMKPKREDKRSVTELNEASKVLATCTYEQGTQWGKEMGLVYGIPVEDIATGLVISCRGWRSIYYNPERKAFLGVAPTSLAVSLVQHKRWTEGMFQVFISKYCPFIYGLGKINLGVQMGYCVYLLWAPISLPTLCYVIIPPICLRSSIPLFPQFTSLWFIPFAYAFFSNHAYSLCEALCCGCTTKGWWNMQRIKLIRRTTAHLFGFIDTVTKQLGLSQTNFDITDKMVTEDVQKRYEQEVMDFGGSHTVMLTMMSTVALLNLFSLLGGIKMILMDLEFNIASQLIMQIVLSALIVIMSLPVYEALFIRSDNGCISSSVMIKSIVLASLACGLAPLIC